MGHVRYVHSGCLVSLVLGLALLSCGLGTASYDMEHQARRRSDDIGVRAATLTRDVAVWGSVGCAALFVVLLGVFQVPFGSVAVTAGGGVYRAGWRWHPFARLLSLEIVNAQGRNYEVPPFPVRTRDQAEFDLSVAVNWRPDPANLLTYLEQGGDTTVPGTLRNIITNRLTKWAYNAGPVDWREALGAHDLSKEALVEELSHQPSGLALVPATSDLLVPGEVASYQYRPLGIIIGGVFIKHIEPRAGSKFGVRDLMLEVEFNLPFERQIERAVKDIEDLDKLERERARMLEVFPERSSEINRKFSLLKTILFDK